MQRAHAQQWDAVASCFFVDACASVLEVINGVRAVLPAGGFWINCGPLLYHHQSKGPSLGLDNGLGQHKGVPPSAAAESSAPGPAEGHAPPFSSAPKLSADELLMLIARSGFEIVEKRMQPSRK